MVWRRSCATRSSDARITAWRRRSGRFEGKGGGRQAIKLSTPTVCAETAGRVCSWFDLPRLSWMMNAQAAAAPRWRCRELETGFCWRVFTLAAEICSYPAARFRWIIAVPSLLPRLRVQSLSPCREGVLSNHGGVWWFDALRLSRQGGTYFYNRRTPSTVIICQSRRVAGKGGFPLSARCPGRSLISRSGAARVSR